MAYPSDTASDGSLMIQTNNFSSGLVSSISAVAGSLTLSSTATLPATGFVTIESEAIEYGANATATGVLSSLTRGADSTTAAIHDSGRTAYANVVAAHHNRSKDEILGIVQDLRNSNNADLDDSVAATATASSIENRLDMVGTRLASLGNSTDWKTGFPGKISKMTQTTASTGFSTSATNFTSTGIQIAITPQTTTSKVIIYASGTLLANGINSSLFTFIRNPGTTTAVDVFTGGGGLGRANAGTTTVGFINVPTFGFFLDSPSTAAAVTYAIAIRSATTTASAAWAQSAGNTVIGLAELMA